MGYQFLGAVIVPPEISMYKYGEKQETTMDTNYQNERYALRNRLMDIYQNKTGAMRQKFGLEDDDDPTDGTEIVERIKSGRYVLEDDKFGLDFIRWRDPALKEDLKGFRTARDTLDDEHSKLLVATSVLDPKDALKQVEAWNN